MSDDIRGIMMSGTALSAPQTFDGTNTVEVSEAVSEAGLDIPPVETSEIAPQFRGKVLRVMDDRLFVVEPGSPPGLRLPS